MPQQLDQKPHPLEFAPLQADHRALLMCIHRRMSPVPSFRPAGWVFENFFPQDRGALAAAVDSLSMRLFCALLIVLFEALSLQPVPLEAAEDALAVQIRVAMTASIERELAAVEKQVGSSFFLLSPPAAFPPLAVAEAAAPSSGCPELTAPERDVLVDNAARDAGIKPEWLRAVLPADARPCAVSPAGGQGLVPLTPDAVREFGVNDPF